MSSLHLDQDSGKLVSQVDRNRRVWYSTGCTFWTDNGKVLAQLSTPSCPHCGKELHTVAYSIFARRYPFRFIELSREQCLANTNSLQQWRDWWMHEEGM